MKLGIGLYRHMLTPAHFRFARQIGCSHVVAHLVDYSGSPGGDASANNQPVGSRTGGWGVAGRVTGPFARGGAESVGVEGVDQIPIPLGMVWNMIYDQHAPLGTLPPITSEELWQRLTRFLQEMLPVAEEAGVVLAAHPDDPPAPTLRGTPRLVYQPHLYQKLLDIRPSASHALEFCLGTIAEMTEGNVYDATDRYSAQGKLAYVHFRNVRGTMPRYHEVFIDEGDIDVLRILGILKKNRYAGILIPDHTPLVECGAPWHAGMAYATGYMRAALRVIEEGGLQP
jgi:mannonate dehydratase